MFTQEPPPNPRSAKRMVLSHFIDEETGSERVSDLPGVTQQGSQLQERGFRAPDCIAFSHPPQSLARRKRRPAPQPTLGSAGPAETEEVNRRNHQQGPKHSFGI